MQCSIFFVEIGECFMVLGQCIEDVKENILYIEDIKITCSFT